MPYRTERTGPTIEQRMAELDRRARAFPRDMAFFTSREFNRHTPKDSNKLDLAVSAVHQITPYKWGVGKISDLGDIDTPAPRGTISDFLSWYRATRAAESDG